MEPEKSLGFFGYLFGALAIAATVIGSFGAQKISLYFDFQRYGPIIDYALMICAFLVFMLVAKYLFMGVCIVIGMLSYGIFRKTFAAVDELSTQQQHEQHLAAMKNWENSWLCLDCGTVEVHKDMGAWP